MNKIYKYPLPGGSDFTIQLPPGAQLLHLATQEPHEQINVWFDVNPEIPTKPTTIRCIGTGWELPDGFHAKYKHIGTVVLFNGLVWHYFMER